jgi:hypothetical protein
MSSHFFASDCPPDDELWALWFALSCPPPSTQIFLYPRIIPAKVRVHNLWIFLQYVFSWTVDTLLGGMTSNIGDKTMLDRVPQKRGLGKSRRYSIFKQQQKQVQDLNLGMCKAPTIHPAPLPSDHHPSTFFYLKTCFLSFTELCRQIPKIFFSYGLRAKLLRQHATSLHLIFLRVQSTLRVQLCNQPFGFSHAINP